ncbi:piggyBac transposable element-derived protein 3 isoform X2 [Amyelois transitella]|uniref:piggyBac transposable element-derived protein 3-like n=2 Tax=Amyelois transitella TaxID=680683 RepID=UPI00067ABDE4|nr:piggyBac transposable element-derived protein 3-like [Amyelois transitella]XP_060804631.1 piggyBac transposable element-derived protein 3-like [Amyelois transitella]XP_060810180.1 piggyBac transposable element-derived protein 3 isoform X2 [Amyelois transitella]
MSRKQTFSASNNYRGLEDAIHDIIEDSDDGLEYDLAIIPPDPSIVTDEEEGFDEDLMPSSLPNDVPGNIEVFVHNIGSLSDSGDSSDDEPLAAKKARKDTGSTSHAEQSRNTVPSRRQALNIPIWRKCAPNYSTQYEETEERLLCENHVKEQLKDLTPVQIFEKLFDDEVFEMIVHFSNLYASQNNRHNFCVTTEELRIFFGILILSGYHKLPREHMYWSLDEDVGVEVVSKAMSRNRFREIKRNLHLVDNNDASTTSDKMFKVRKLSEVLMKKYNQWGIFHEFISIDESMIRYYGHHPAKQFIRGKPVRFGYKNWVAASSSGYCYSFDIYCGKSTTPTTEPLGTRVVKLLLNKLTTNAANHKVFFDNFFTSCDLLYDLRQSGFRATGTVRENRTKKCPLSSVKEMMKKSRAVYDYRFDKNNEILLVRWKDNSICTMATNYDSYEPLGLVKRWCPEKKEKAEVTIPHLFQNYNKGMGGVDELDQSISLYRIGIHGKKWWWVLFTYMIDMTIANAWRLHVLAKEDPMDQLLFRRNIARYYLRHSIQKQNTRPSSSNIDGLQLDGKNHVPEKLVKRVRCVVCHNRSRWGCKKCKKTLCIEKSCFADFHS